MSRLLVVALVLAVAGCGTSRVIVSTGTTIGLKATPGDGNSRPPQVTLGYKRAEVSMVPTKGEAVPNGADAFSTLAALHFETQFFGETSLDSFIGTGRAAVGIQQQEGFKDQIEQVALVERFRVENRLQRAIARRITDEFRALTSPGKRDEIRSKAVALKLVPPETSDAAFEQGRLVGAAVRAEADVTAALQELERFTAAVVAR
jgi:hypothetical protein